MYSNKIHDILEDIENKELEVAGGSVVGIILSTVNSLIKYIANLTIGKKSYAEVQEKVRDIIVQAEELKTKALLSIDKDKEILEKILSTYKNRKENPSDYQATCIQATYFALEVVEFAYKTLNLSRQISEVGNKMLASDFKICEYYSIASIKASKENYFINYNSISYEEEKEKLNKEYIKILDKYEVK